MPGLAWGSGKNCCRGGENCAGSGIIFAGSPHFAGSRDSGAAAGVELRARKAPRCAGRALAGEGKLLNVTLGKFYEKIS